MKVHALVLTLAALPLGLHAAPFAKGDAKAGEKLHKELYLSCHIARFGGKQLQDLYPDGSTGEERLGVGTLDRHLQHHADDPIAPEDEANLGAYLNATYYKFK